MASLQKLGERAHWFLNAEPRALTRGYGRFRDACFSIGKVSLASEQRFRSRMPDAAFGQTAPNVEGDARAVRHNDLEKDIV